MTSNYDELTRTHFKTLIWAANKINIQERYSNMRIMTHLVFRKQYQQKLLWNPLVNLRVKEANSHF